jgi:hypothetical protein
MYSLILIALNATDAHSFNYIAVAPARSEKSCRAAQKNVSAQANSAAICATDAEVAKWISDHGCTRSDALDNIEMFQVLSPHMVMMTCTHRQLP